MLEIEKVGRLDDVDRSKFYVETDKFALIDADSMLYYCLKGDITFEDAKIRLDEQMFQLLAKLGTPHYAAITTPGHTFRKDVGFVKPYKGNRKGKKTPPVFYAVRAYAVDEWNFYSVQGLEADDCMGLYGLHDANAVICSPDKDVIRQLPGKHWNYGKGEWVTTSEDDAWRFLWQQVATGDSVDQIPGIHGMGEKTIAKVLLTVRKEDFPLRILQLYIEKLRVEYGVKEAVNRFKETLDLVYMLRHEHELLRYGITLPELRKSNVKDRYER